MANDLTREETADILEEVYKNNLEGTELAKKITNIPKLLDKFEGKYDRMITALKKKYPNTEPSENPFSDFASIEKGESKKENQETEEETTEEEEETTEDESLNWEDEEPEEESPIVDIELSEGELTRVRVSVLIEEAYRQNIDDPDKKIAGIEKLLDKFEGKYEKLLEAVYKKYPIRTVPENENGASNAFEEILKAIDGDNSNYSKWLELADYYENLGMIGRSIECRNYALSLQD